jgi:hypothetical protein
VEARERLERLERAPRACASASSPLPDRRETRGQAGERPPPRDKTGPIIPAGVPFSATTLARRIDGADVPIPNVLSARHLARIRGGLLYAANSNVPWATLLARTFDVDVKACARCAERLAVRALVTEHAIARKTEPVDGQPLRTPQRTRTCARPHRFPAMAARMSASVTMSVIGSSGEGSKPSAR